MLEMYCDVENTPEKRTRFMVRRNCFVHQRIISDFKHLFASSMFNEVQCCMCIIHKMHSTS